MQQSDLDAEVRECHETITYLQEEMAKLKKEKTQLMTQLKREQEKVRTIEEDYDALMLEKCRAEEEYIALGRARSRNPSQDRNLNQDDDDPGNDHLQGRKRLEHDGDNVYGNWIACRNRHDYLNTSVVGAEFAHKKFSESNMNEMTGKFKKAGAGIYNPMFRNCVASVRRPGQTGRHQRKQ